MIGERYWTTGIVVRWMPGRDEELPGRWSAQMEFRDNGFCNDDADAGRVSTEGRLHSRYFVEDGQKVTGVAAAVAAVIADAERLGISVQPPGGGPCTLWVDESCMTRPGWRDAVSAVADGHGWPWSER